MPYNKYFCSVGMQLLLIHWSKNVGLHVLMLTMGKIMNTLLVSVYKAHHAWHLTALFSV